MSRGEGTSIPTPNMLVTPPQKFGGGKGVARREGRGRYRVTVGDDEFFLLLTFEFGGFDVCEGGDDSAQCGETFIYVSSLTETRSCCA